jgi:hypothetical protein
MYVVLNSDRETDSTQREGLDDVDRSFRGNGKDIEDNNEECSRECVDDVEDSIDNSKNGDDNSVARANDEDEDERNDKGDGKI